MVYNRKPHAWTERDVERVVRGFSENTETDVPMMSDLADRVLFWIARRLALDEAAGFAAKVVIRLFDIVRGTSYEPARRTARSSGIAPKITVDEIDWMPGGLAAETDDRTSNLRSLRDLCSSMIEYIDQEISDE